MGSTDKQNQTVQSHPALIVLICLGIILLALFFKSFQANQILFSNDGPLGNNVTAYAGLPQAFTGMWQDIHWLGGSLGNAPINITWTLLFALGPVAFAKFYIPITILILGLSAWWFFRQLEFHPIVCLLGALAAALNSDFFSYGCWGLGTLPLTVAMIFLALGALCSRKFGNPWLQAVLAGLAVGMGIMEGFDAGAILSLFIAAFLLFQVVSREGETQEKLKTAAGRLALVVVFAAFISAQTLTSLISTQLTGVEGMGQTEQEAQARWDWATQWSLPKNETFRVLIAGLYGYRLDTENGGAYWGAVGRTPGWEQHKQGLIRHSGSGFYAGVLVVLIALWAVIQNARREGSPFSQQERRMIWFWFGVAVLSLLLSYGRHFFLYRIFYELPYFSTIRNPIKFLHPFSIALVILFAYGLQGLYRSRVEKSEETSRRFAEHLKEWWRNLMGFEKKWTVGSLLAVGGGLLWWLIYVSSNTERANYLQTVGFGPDEARAIASFSGAAFGWFLLFLILSVGALLAALSGWFAGKRARWFGVVLGLILVVDLAKANSPWIVYLDYKEKYADDVLSEFLGNEPYKHRVTMWPTPINQAMVFLQKVYGTEWLQHQFPYHNIQSLEFSQEPRVEADNAAFRLALPETNRVTLLRRWQLTNTKYIIGLSSSNFVSLLNQELDPENNPFEVALSFSIDQKTPEGPFKAVHAAQEPFAVIEYKNALPRAKLYSNWRVAASDTNTLQILRDPAFDPRQAVVVEGDVPPSWEETNDAEGSVEFVSYAPKRIVLKAQAGQPVVLLLNDKFDEDWRVTVDGEPRAMLRCNFIMRGVYLDPGEHEVEFRFTPPTGPMYVTLLAILLGIGLGGWVIWTGTKRKSDPAKEVSAPGLRERKQPEKLG